MAGVVFALVALAALAGIAIGGRHIYLKLDRPGGFECSLRVANGEVDGLTAKFRAGWAGREGDTFMWRRIAWPSPAIRFPATSIRLDDERAPSVRDHLVSVPAHFSVVPVDLPDGVQLDLAFARRKLPRILAIVGGQGPAPRRRRAR